MVALDRGRRQRHLGPPYHTPAAQWAFQRFGVPFRGIGRSLIGALQEFEQRAIRIIRGAHGVIGKDEFAERFAEERRIGPRLDGAKARRFGIGVGIECGIVDCAAAEPEGEPEAGDAGWEFY